METKLKEICDKICDLTNSSDITIKRTKDKKQWYAMVPEKTFSNNPRKMCVENCCYRYVTALGSDPYNAVNNLANKLGIK